VHVEYGRSPNGTARLRLLRGNGTRCDTENWAALVTECPASAELERNGSGCLESLDMNNSKWFHAPFAVTIGMWVANETPRNTAPRDVVIRTARGTQGDMSICYEPNGLVRWLSAPPPAPGGPVTFSPLNTGAAGGGGLMFAVGLFDRSLDDLVNTPRVVLYPLAGTPRRLR
jgi:hypothetical protein